MGSGKRKSNKLSSTKASYAEQLKEFVFFVDRSSGRYRLVEGLRRLGLQVEAHDDHFRPTEADVDWIAVCGERGWIVISSDKNIKRNPLENQAIMASGVAAFFFTSPNITSEMQIKAVEAGLRHICRLVLNQKRPFISRISPSGVVELWMDAKGKDRLRALEEMAKKRKSK